MAITTRAGKGSALTFAEMDTNFTELDAKQDPPVEGPFVDGDKTKLDTAVQPGDLGTAAAAATGDFATAAQGALAATAVQPAALSGYSTTGHTHDTLANVATATILGRATAGSGASEELTPAQARTLLNVADGATADQTGAEIKAAYEAEADTNAYTDTDAAKVAIAVKSDTTQGGTGSVSAPNIVLITETAHTALGTKDANTLYFRTGA